MDQELDSRSGRRKNLRTFEGRLAGGLVAALDGVGALSIPQSRDAVVSLAWNAACQAKSLGASRFSLRLVDRRRYTYRRKREFDKLLENRSSINGH